VLVPMVWIFRAVRTLIVRGKQVIGEIRIVERQVKI